MHIDRVRASQRVRATNDESTLDRAVPFVDPSEMQFEQGAAAAAFGSLPERWQLVLWHLDVEGNKPADIAPLLGMSANSVSALAYRAREGLRQAYLQSHLAPALHASCRTTTGLLGAYVRHGLSSRDAAKVDTHLEDCSRCTGLYLELADINSNLSAILGPALLGTAFAGYAAGTGVGALGLKLLVSQAGKLVVEPAKSVGATVVGSGAQGMAAAAVVTSVAAAGTIAVTTNFNAAGDKTPATSQATAAPPPTATTSPRDRTTPRVAIKPAAVITTPAPAPIPTPTRTPADVVTPAPPPSPEAPGSSPEPTVEPIPTAPPSPAPVVEPPVVATDYGVSAPVITSDDTLLQRRFTVAVTAANSGRAADQSVTVTMQFNQLVQFRGVVSAGWDCGPAVRNQPLTTLTCLTTLPAGQGTTFIAKAKGLRPAGTITVSSTDDPQPANNTVSFRSPVYQYPG